MGAHFGDGLFLIGPSEVVRRVGGLIGHLRIAPVTIHAGDAGLAMGAVGELLRFLFVAGEA